MVPHHQHLFFTLFILGGLFFLLGSPVFAQEPQGVLYEVGDDGALVVTIPLYKELDVSKLPPRIQRLIALGGVEKSKTAWRVKVKPEWLVAHDLPPQTEGVPCQVSEEKVPLLLPTDYKP